MVKNRACREPRVGAPGKFRDRSDVFCRKEKRAIAQPHEQQGNIPSVCLRLLRADGAFETICRLHDLRTEKGGSLNCAVFFAAILICAVRKDHSVQAVPSRIDHYRSRIRPFRNWLISRTRQLRLPPSGGFAFEQSLQVWVGVDCRGVVLHQTTRIGSWTVIAVLLPAEHP